MEGGAIFHSLTVEKFIISVPVMAIKDHGVQLLKYMMADGEIVKVQK